LVLSDWVMGWEGYIHVAVGYGDGDEGDGGGEDIP
jgi:hypothetical protein